MISMSMKTTHREITVRIYYSLVHLLNQQVDTEAKGYVSSSNIKVPIMDSRMTFEYLDI